MFVDAAESSNVCQPSWYLIAFGCRDIAVCEKLVDVLAGRDSILAPVFYYYLAVSSQCDLAFSVMSYLPFLSGI